MTQHLYLPNAFNHQSSASSCRNRSKLRNVDMYLELLSTYIIMHFTKYLIEVSVSDLIGRSNLIGMRN